MVPGRAGQDGLAQGAGLMGFYAPVAVRRHQGQHFVQDGAEGVEVRALVGGPAFRLELLGGTVIEIALQCMATATEVVKYEHSRGGKDEIPC